MDGANQQGHAQRDKAGDDAKQAHASKTARRNGEPSICLVAGEGFEPSTFGL
jgi:hypothetical protein